MAIREIKDTDGHAMANRGDTPFTDRNGKTIRMGDIVVRKADVKEAIYLYVDGYHRQGALLVRQMVGNDPRASICEDFEQRDRCLPGGVEVYTDE